MLVLVILNLDKIIIKLFVSVKSLGFYSVASQLSSLIITASLVVGAGLAPKIINELKNEKNYKYFKLKFFTFTSITFGLICIFITLFSNFIVVLLYGESYNESSNLFVITIWIAYFISIVSLRTRFLVAEKNTFIILKMSFLTLITILFFSYILLPIYGVYGVACSVLIGWALNVFYFLITRLVYNYRYNEA